MHFAMLRAHRAAGHMRYEARAPHRTAAGHYHGGRFSEPACRSYAVPR